MAISKSVGSKISRDGRTYLERHDAIRSAIKKAEKTVAASDVKSPKNQGNRKLVGPKT